MGNLIIEKVKVELLSGLQARQAIVIANIAEKYLSEAFIEKGYKKIDCKSVMGIISLGIETEEEVTFLINGPDENKVLEELKSFLSGKTYSELTQSV